MTGTIDLSAQMRTIRGLYPGRDGERQAAEEAAKLWGGIECSEYGVVLKEEKLKFTMPKDDRWYGEVFLAHAPNGYWMVDTGYGYPNGSQTGPLSVFKTIGYPSRREAITAGIDELIARFEKLADYRDSYQHTTRLGCERMIKELKAQKDQQMQMALF